MEAKTGQLKSVEHLKYLCLVLFPILSIYQGYYVFNLGIVVLFFVMVLEILVQRGVFYINKDILIVLSLLAVLNIITGFIHMNTIEIRGYFNNSVQIFVIAVISAYFVKTSVVDREIYYKYLKAVALICSVYLIIQSILYTQGIVLTGGLPLPREVELPIEPVSYGRPNSLFREPAHFSIYVLPVYVISLYKKHYVSSLIMLVALILSTSSTGIAIGAIVTTVFIFQNKRIHVILKIIAVVAALTVLILYLPMLFGNEAIQKLSFSNLKTNIRVFGALKYFRLFGVSEVIFGIGLNQLAGFVKVFTERSVDNLTNGFVFSLYSFGMLGGILWNMYIVKLLKHNKNVLHIIVFVLVYLIEQVLFNHLLIHMLLILYVYPGYETNVKQTDYKGQLRKHDDEEHGDISNHTRI